MLGISLKLWRMEWSEEDSNFSTIDSSVFVFQDRLDEELVYVQNIVRLYFPHNQGQPGFNDLITRKLLGDDSLTEVFDQTLASLKYETELPKEEPPTIVSVVTGEVKDMKEEGYESDNPLNGFPEKAEVGDVEGQCGSSTLDDKENSDTDLPSQLNKAVKSFCCEMCGQHLKTDKSLLRHKEKVHSDCDGLKTKGLKQLPCNHQTCTKTFTNRKSLYSHMEVEHGQDMSPGNKERFLCNHCGKKCASKHDLEKHALRHTDEKNFVCMECGKQFKGEGGLKVHMKRHQGIFDHKCDECDAAYTSASALNAHRLAKHTPGHSFMCSECGQGFKYQNALDKHKTLHTGEKRYQCRYCEKRFRLFTIRANHERVHRGVKEFQCTMCPKQFMQQDQLRVHTKRHLNQRDHVCEICNKAFIEPVGLRKHQCAGRPVENYKTLS